MCIVRGNIVLLRKRHMQPPSGQKEKLDHPDIGRQRIGMQRLGIGEIGIAAEQAVDDWRDEALLKQVLWLRFFQRQRGKDGQLDRAVGGGPRVERVDDVVRLAEPKRQPDHQIAPDIADDLLRDRLGVGEQFRHQGSPGAVATAGSLRIGRSRRQL